MKKILPIILLVVMALAALAIKRCNNQRGTATPPTTETRTQTKRSNTGVAKRNDNTGDRFNRAVAKLYFTKHAKCRMKCRHITQQEVREILAEGTINYNKSDLNDPKGPTYALEGQTDEGQQVRIIFAPKQTHMTVVTVIDLGEEHPCNCD